MGTCAASKSSRAALLFERMRAFAEVIADAEGGCSLRVLRLKMCGGESLRDLVTEALV